MKVRILLFVFLSLFFSGSLLISGEEALAEKITGYFIILKVDHVDSLKDTGDQKVIMQRATELLQEKLNSLKLKSVELRKKANDIIILSYQGSDDPWQVAQSIQPKDLVVSFTVIGIFRGSEITQIPSR
jgi:ferredoxin-fold anticodon binding domain-containing protein